MGAPIAEHRNLVEAVILRRRPSNTNRSFQGWMATNSPTIPMAALLPVAFPRYPAIISATLYGNPTFDGTSLLTPNVRQDQPRKK